MMNPKILAVSPNKTMGRQYLYLIYKSSFFFVALFWNLAVFSVFSFFASWLFDILGSIIDSQIIKDYAYVIAILTSVGMFWFGFLAAILSSLFKCKSCGYRLMKSRFPFFVSFINTRCKNCGLEVKIV